MRRSFFFTFIFICLIAAFTLSLLACQRSSDTAASGTALYTKGKTFLILGIDSVSYSSDVIMLAHIQSDSKTLKLLQIPRDSYTDKGKKINSIFAEAAIQAKNDQKSDNEIYFAGADALSGFLENALGIKIESRAILTLQDFRILVDTVGGVPITLPRDLDYEDPTQDLAIHLKAGEQLLDGKAAEGLVRCRNAYLDADYGRMDAQKLFMAAFFKKLKYHTPPNELFTFIRKAHRYIYTDITLKESLALGAAVLRAKEDALWFATCKGEGLKIGGIWYEVIPKATLTEAAAWLEGCYNETANAFVSDHEKARAIYEAPPVSQFTPRSANETEK